MRLAFKLGEMTAEPGNLSSISLNTSTLVNQIAWIDSSFFFMNSNKALELSEKYLPSFDPNMYNLDFFGITKLKIVNIQVHGPKKNPQ